MYVKKCQCCFAFKIDSIRTQNIVHLPKMYQYFSCASVSMLSQKTNLLIEKNVYLDMNSYETGTNYRHSVSRKIKYCLFWWSVFLLYHTAFVSLSELGHFFEVCSIESFCSQEMNNAKLKDFTVISCALFEQLQVSFHGLKNWVLLKWQCLYMFAFFLKSKIL